MATISSTAGRDPSRPPGGPSKGGPGNAHPPSSLRRFLGLSSTPPRCSTCGHSLDPLADKNSKRMWERSCTHCRSGTPRPSPCPCHDCAERAAKRKSMITPDNPPASKLPDLSATPAKMSGLAAARNNFKASRQDLGAAFRAANRSFVDLGTSAAQSLRPSRSQVFERTDPASVFDPLTRDAGGGGSEAPSSRLGSGGLGEGSSFAGPSRSYKSSHVRFEAPSAATEGSSFSAFDYDMDFDASSGKFGRSSSQPSEMVARKLLSKFRRARSDQNPDAVFYNGGALPNLPETNFTTVEALRAAVQRVLKLRLERNQIDTTGLDMRSFDWCLPKSLDQLAQWRLFLEEPTAADNALLAQIFDLEQNTADTPAPEPDSKMFYVRSFEYSATQLIIVLNYMLHDGYDMNLWIFSWLEKAQLLPGITRLTLRYCGQTENSPWTRHHADIYKGKSLKSFMGQFLRTVGFAFPEVLTNATVCTFSKANVIGMALADAHLDFTEQVLIALFGDAVLNTELGGTDVLFLTEEDQIAFGHLQTRTVQSLQQHTQPCSEQTYGAIQAYAHNVRAYVNSHPTTRKGRRQFDDLTEQMLIRQGIPRVLSDGSAVMITLASDLGEDHEQDEGTFWEAGGRSADAIIHIYDHIADWDQGSGMAYDPGLFRSLVDNSNFPMADVFAWYVKHKDDYIQASELLASYVNATHPWIVFTYGSLPTFAAQRHFAPFTKNEFDNKISKDNYHFRQQNTSWAQSVLGVPEVRSFNAGKGNTTGKEFLLIPCYHPGFTGHAGILKEKLTRLMVLMHGLAWSAMDQAIKIDLSHADLPRTAKINMLSSVLATKTSLTHPFGKALAQAKAEYAMVVTAHNQSFNSRAENVELRAPREGLLAGKTVRKPARRSVQAGETVVEFGNGFEVKIEETTWFGSGVDKKRHSLTWTEDDGQERSLVHIILPPNVVPADATVKHFLFYVSGGIDIRNNANLSLGDRKPIVGVYGRSETLPLATIALSMCDRSEAAEFFEHWEEITRLSVIDTMNSRSVSSDGVGPSALSAASEGRLPASYFAQSITKRGFPFNRSTTLINTGGAPWNVYIQKLRTQYLPVHHGDLLYLVDQFLSEQYPSGGDIDMAPACLRGDSVFKRIADFCSKPKYQHHPHLRTFLALASMAEQGLDERNIPVNAFRMAVQVLRGKFTEVKKVLKLNVQNQPREFLRQKLDIQGGRLHKVFRDVEEPELERDVEIEEDLEVQGGDEEEGQDDPDDKGKGRADEHADDMLLDL